LIFADHKGIYLSLWSPPMSWDHHTVFCHFKTIVYHFSVALLTCAHYFCVLHQYPPCTDLVLEQYLLCTFFVSRGDIPRAFHSMHYTMPKFNTPPPRTNTLRAPLTKLSRDNIYPYCACTNQTPLRSTNNVHTTHAIIMCVHTVRTLLCVCRPHNAKFSVCTRTPTFFRAMPKFRARTITPTFFHAVPKFSARNSTPTFFHVTPKI
jgi:hypothetical protein